MPSAQPLPESPQEEALAQAVQVARLYYEQGLTTGAVAARLGLSRPKVSRLLALARRSGIVNIQIHDPRRHPQTLQSALQARWPGVQVQVVALPAHATPEVRLERVALAGAQWLRRTLRPQMVVGLAWGNTTEAISRALPPLPLSGVEFVQLNGSASVSEFSSGFVGSTLSRLAEAVGGRAHLFPVPTFFDDPATRRAMWRERSVQHVLALQRRAEVLLYSVGSHTAAVPSYVYAAGYLDEADVQHLQQEGAVGDIATVFFREDGRGAGLSLNARSSGPDLDFFREHPNAVCVVADVGKARALRAALNSGLCRTLIVDETTAAAVLEETVPKGTGPR